MYEEFDFWDSLSEELTVFLDNNPLMYTIPEGFKLDNRIITRDQNDGPIEYSNMWRNIIKMMCATRYYHVIDRAYSYAYVIQTTEQAWNYWLVTHHDHRDLMIRLTYEESFKLPAIKVCTAIQVLPK